MTRYFLTAGLLSLAAPAFADDPRPTPLTRPEMKRLLEDMKQRTPRIPLPPLTDEEKARLGDRADAGYEGRLRSVYMPGAGDGRGAGGGLGAGGQPGGGQNADPALTLDYKFKTQLFWIVSRANNCQYCLGHQEGKLLSAGMAEDEIAALDGDWATASPKERTAYAFARKFTLAPHTMTDADVAGLKQHFTEPQILEMVLSMAGNNQINRWKEGVGVPQGRGGMSGGGRRGAGEQAKAERPKDDKPHTYVTPTSDAFKTTVTKVAALTPDASGVACPTVSTRPPLEPSEAGLTAARARTPRLPLADEAKAKEVVGDGPAPQWVRLLANFPVVGKARVMAQRTAEDKGDLSPLTKAQVSWIVARQDRAWYAAEEARRRLLALGQTDADIAKLDGDWNDVSPADRARFTLARNLAASPVVLTDSEVAEAVKQIGPRDTVQLVSYVTVRASFDRITEAAGLTAGQ